MDRRKFITSLISFGVGLPSGPHDTASRSPKLERYGDAGQVGIPISGLLMAIGKSDRQGARQVVEGAVWNSVLTIAIKRGINARRPNEGDLSFPSGHTSNATQGAAFIFFRYSPTFGLVAYAAAMLVGYSRVENRYHYWRDVIAGMALATGVQYLITKKGWSLISSEKTSGWKL